jgi:anti-anti-sigma factor
MTMTIDVETSDGPVRCAIVALTGELDASNYEQVMGAVQQAWDSGARGLALDLTHLSFMASSGLIALYTAVRVFRGDPAPDPESGWSALHELGNDQSAAGNVRLIGVQPPVERVLERTGLRRLFAVDPDRAAAMAALGG